MNENVQVAPEVVDLDAALNPVFGQSDAGSSDQPSSPGTVDGEAAHGSAPAEAGAPEDRFTQVQPHTPEEESRFKSMQADYTRKTTDVANERRRLASEAREQTALIQQGLVLQQLMRNPAFAQVVQAIQSGEAPQAGAPGPFVQSGEDEAGLPDDLDPDVRQYVERRIQKEVNALSQSQQQLQLRLEAQAFMARNPDWEKFQSGMAAAWQANSKLSFDDAYRVAKSTAIERENAQLRQTLAALQQGKHQNLATDPGTQVTNALPAQPPPKTWEEAAQQAIRVLRGQGMRFYGNPDE